MTVSLVWATPRRGVQNAAFDTRNCNVQDATPLSGSHIIRESALFIETAKVF
jgi:hypothetical protein